jgi:hypothetical protein
MNSQMLLVAISKVSVQSAAAGRFCNNSQRFLNNLPRLSPSVIDSYGSPQSPSSMV